MSSLLTFLVLFSLIAGINLLVLFLILFFRKNNTLSNKALGILILIPGLALIFNPVIYSGGFYNYPFLLNLSNCGGFLFGPALILYIHLMKGESYRFKKKDLFHLLPLPLVIGYGLFLSFQSTEFIHETYAKIYAGENFITNLIYLAQLIHFAIYITWGIRKVKTYKKPIKRNLTSYESVHYNWLWFFVTRLLVLNILVIVVYAIQMSFFPNYAIFADLLATPIAASCFYPIIFFKSLSNNLLFDKESFETLVANNELIHKNHFSLSKVKDKGKAVDNGERLIQIKYELEQFLQENKIYKTPQLSVEMLANKIGCGKTLLSQTINRLYGTTYFEFINNYRVEEAKQLLLNPKYFHLKIDSIGELAGFSSRTSFFSVFKKHTHLSPTSYRQQQLEKISN